MNRLGVSLANVPAKVMLAGEYGTLHGGPGLAATLDCRLEVRAQAAPTGSFCIDSDLWDKALRFQTPPKSLEPKQLMLTTTVLESARYFGLDGANVRVMSNIDPQHGIGSSSALRLAVAFALRTLAQSSISAEQTAAFAYQLQLAEQEQASGYDILTQWQGGVIEFRNIGAWPGCFVRHEWDPEFKSQLHLFVGGAGTATGGLVRNTSRWLEENDRLPAAKRNATKMVNGFLSCLNAGAPLYSVFPTIREQRAIFSESPAAVPRWHEALAKVAGLDQDWTYKTTGAGGEDALLVLAPRSLVAARLASPLRSLGLLPCTASFTNEGLYTTTRDDP